ncbi:hypothetical protein CYMTET_42708 [Cymbomonas tetramitiformis]|uniref:Secreted protein n=1 Tax=Cymbomonas tetramitiformis TaxID=36881 RepID=A0AAE0C4W8_9CHLO|nr:hypothetical protein CYMTET_42708 [Cymbomonas tetramitiformis]
MKTVQFVLVLALVVAMLRVTMYSLPGPSEGPESRPQTIKVSTKVTSHTKARVRTEYKLSVREQRKSTFPLAFPLFSDSTRTQ